MTSEVRSSGALRIDVRGPVDLIVQLTPDQVSQAEPAGDSTSVRRLGRSIGAAVRQYEVIVDGWRFEVAVEPARQADLRERAARAASAHRPASGTLRAQIPGRVTRLWVEAGEQVEAGQRLLAIEAMKMENEVRAPHEGRVQAIHVAVGARVERDAELVTLD